MAAAVREFLSGVDNGDSGGLDVTRITGTVTTAADLLVAAHGIDYYTAGGMTTPTGSAGAWTSQILVDVGTNLPKIRIWTRLAGSDGAQTVTVPHVSNAANYLALWVISGTGLTVVDPKGAAQTAASTALVLPSMTLDTGSGLQLGAFLTEFAAINHSYTSSGLTKDGELDAATYSTMSAGRAAIAAPGATGTRTVTGSASRKCAVAGLLVRDTVSARDPGGDFLLLSPW